MHIPLIILSIFVLFALLCYVCFRIAIIRGRQVDLTKGEFSEKDPLYPYRDRFIEAGKWYDNLYKEPMEITSFDGLKLYGEFVPNENSRKTIILMHGFHSTKSDFCLALKNYRNLGFNLMLIDQRCHSRSEGRYITFGIKEKYDCRDWVNAILEKYGEDMDIVLSGISMGASTVLMASGLELPKNVKCIIADSGFTSGWDIVRNTAKSINRHIPNFLVEMVNLLCRVFADFDLKEDNTLLALKKCELPVLFIHGTADPIVPCEMTLRNHAVCHSPKELVTVVGAGHGMGYLIEPERCSKAIESFLEKYL